jgi:hypothetical protein
MKKTLLRKSWIPALLLVPMAFAMKEAGAADAPGRRDHLSGLAARITLPDGTVQMAKLEGLGCSQSICSRVAIKGKASNNSLASFWLDSITAIKDTTERGALLVMKDGTRQRISLITDFRVLYLADQSRSPMKLDLTKIKSLEFLPPTE